MKHTALATVLLLALSSPFLSCKKILFEEDPANTPLSNLDYLHQDFKEYYGLFQVKQINWDSLYNATKATLNNQSSETELYNALVKMISPLQDNHITLYPDARTGLPRWSHDLRHTDGAYVVEDYNLDVVKKYVHQWRDWNEHLSSGFINDHIGYVNIRNMDGRQVDYSSTLDQIFANFEGTTGLVLDLRENAGGYDPSSQYIAGRFAPAGTDKLYMTTRKKTGPGPYDFSSSVEWRLRPTGKSQYTLPVIVLTTRATVSAAETGLLALRQLPQVQTMGDTTSGAFSDEVMHQLPNGWLFTLSIGDYRAADGKSYEGVGLAPDILVRNQKADLLNNQDKALERAIEQLQ